MSCHRKVLLGECGICDKPKEKAKKSAWIPITKDTVIPDGWYWMTEILGKKRLVDLFYIKNNKWYAYPEDDDETGDKITEFEAYMIAIKPEPFTE